MYHNNSIRLRGFDYSKRGIYFITICTADKNFYFGNIKDSKMIYSQIGKLTHKFWTDIPIHFDHVKLDVFLIMPDHLHSLLILDYCERPKHKTYHVPYSFEKFGKPTRGTIPTIVRSFKSAVTRWCHKNGHSYFKWQPRYYDHIVRDD